MSQIDSPKLPLYMEKHRDKIQKTSEKNQEIETKSWADLPPEILALIIGKLHSGDRIRFRAVCKGWQLSKDWMKQYTDHLPWVCNLSWAVSDIDCELFDPYLHKVSKISKHVEKLDYLSDTDNFDDDDDDDVDEDDDAVIVYGSKQGWLIVGCNGEDSPFFIYNPFSNEVILLPYLEYLPSVATFSGNPASEECEVFVFCRDEVIDDVYIASYRLNKDQEWSIEFLETTEDECCGMQYIDGELFCLFEDHILMRYTLADRSWTLLHEPDSPRGDRDKRYNVERLWLVEDAGDLLMVCKLQLGFVVNELCIFYFNWSDMSWDDRDLVGTAFFISGKIAMTTPLLDDNREIIEDCRVFFFDDEDDWRFTCYSIVERRKKIKSQEYGWIKKPMYNMAFIVPSHSRN